MSLSPCWDCVNKAHCSRRGGSQPCKYYIGPAMKVMPSRPCEPAVRMPRHVASGSRPQPKTNDSSAASSI